MISVFKLSPQGEVKTRYEGEVIERTPEYTIISARWTMPARDLGYTRFEPGDHFIEYYYTNRWFNVFEVSDTQGERKGWYCNIAEPARISAERIEQIDLYLDVWISAGGIPLLLDEDEFAAAPLSTAQRAGAQEGLHMLLSLLSTRQAMFAHLAPAE